MGTLFEVAVIFVDVVFCDCACIRNDRTGGGVDESVEGMTSTASLVLFRVRNCRRTISLSYVNYYRYYCGTIMDHYCVQ